MPERKPDLFEFASAIVTKPGTGTTQIVRRQMLDARLPGAPFDGVPDNVCRNASLLQLPEFGNPPE